MVGQTYARLFQRLEQVLGSEEATTLERGFREQTRTLLLAAVKL